MTSVRCLAALCVLVLHASFPTAVLAIDSGSAEQAVRSKDPAVAGPAAEQLLKAANRADPLAVMHAAMLQFNQGKKSEAVFWFYAGQLRARYSPEVSGENAQVLTIHVMMGAPINQYALRDVPAMTAAIQKALLWDEQTIGEWAFDRGIDLKDPGLVQRRKKARDGLLAFVNDLNTNRERYEQEAKATPVQEPISIPTMPAKSIPPPLPTLATSRFFLQDALPSEKLRLGNLEIVARGSQIAGKDASFWALRYYEWLGKNKEKFIYQGASVQKDTTGKLCSSLQNGPVWFLTNFQYGKVTRACDIPANVHVLIPLLEVLLAPTSGTTAPCGELTSTARKFASEESRVSLTIDGQKLENARDYEATSGCFERDDPNESGKKQSVAFHGYWIFLKPLPRGSHRIEFTGEPSRRYYSSSQNLVHDVTYEISVR